MRKRLICILLVICLVLGIAACDDSGGGDNQEITLSAPTNLRIVENGDTGTVMWNAVENAESYIVTINDGEPREITETSYVIQPLTVDYDISVVACRKGSKNSEAATIKFAKHEVSVAISGGSECRSGKTLQLEAVVSNTSNTAVTWEITAGNTFAEISAAGLITAKTVSGDKLITVKATSVVDTSKSATKTITIVAKPDLTDDMFADLDYQKISYSGRIDVETWHIASGQLVGSTTLHVETAMDAEQWGSRDGALNSLRRYAGIDMISGAAT
ncbi:MAG: fibronectin type III domain-containing protein, partial [Clostridiales bacterium]|nr:fibronectin type III domain-containing protein [Clostridiales bacterium]